MEKKTEQAGIGLFVFSIILSIIFASLKLLKLWELSWFWVVFPMILVFAIVLLIILVFLIFFILLWLKIFS